MHVWTNGRFTPFSQADHPPVTDRQAVRRTISSMRRITFRTVGHYLASAFVASVTLCLLAFVFGQAARGVHGLPGMVVYAFAAGFGLEYMGAAWTGGWTQRRARGRLQS